MFRIVITGKNKTLPLLAGQKFHFAAQFAINLFLRQHSQPGIICEQIIIRK